jgi:hypothetical protein
MLRIRMHKLLILIDLNNILNVFSISLRINMNDLFDTNFQSNYGFYKKCIH